MSKAYNCVKWLIQNLVIKGGTCNKRRHRPLQRKSPGPPSGSPAVRTRPSSRCQGTTSLDTCSLPSPPVFNVKRGGGCEKRQCRTANTVLSIPRDELCFWGMSLGDRILDVLDGGLDRKLVSMPEPLAPSNFQIDRGSV